MTDLRALEVGSRSSSECSDRRQNPRCWSDAATSSTFRPVMYYHRTSISIFLFFQLSSAFFNASCILIWEIFPAEFSIAFSSRMSCEVGFHFTLTQKGPRQISQPPQSRHTKRIRFFFFGLSDIDIAASCGFIVFKLVA